MRPWLVLVLLLVAPSVAASAPCVDDAAFDRATFEARVGALAAKELDGRAPGTPGDVAARAIIAERFACLGLAPAFGDSYEQPFTVEGGTTANLVGSIAGETDDIILVAAHHDHLGRGHLGANDNASGVVALLAVAQAMVQRETRPARTIVFAAFGAEESGMHGSYYYAAHAPAGLPVDRIVQVINLDMVGSHSSRGYVAALGTFKKLAATKLLRSLDDRYRSLSVAFGGKARGSDFEPFCKLGTPYVFFWTPDARCYHKTCDTADRLDYARMVDIARLAADLTAALADTEVDLAKAKENLGCFGKRQTP